MQAGARWDGRSLIMSSKMAFCSRRGTAAALLCTLLMTIGALAQSPQTVKFEVASVKLAAGDKDAHSYMQGGPGTADPERIVYERQSFARLLCAGYGIDFDQISGPAGLARSFTQSWLSFHPVVPAKT
jgi:hypothetical protein